MANERPKTRPRPTIYHVTLNSRTQRWYLVRSGQILWQDSYDSREDAIEVAFAAFMLDRQRYWKP